jgi:hypothetical protein
MKMKSLAVLAVSGLLTVSFAYAAPAMTDDLNADDQAMQTATGDNNGMQIQDSTQGSSASDSTGSSTDANSPAAASTDANSGITGTNSENTDEGSPVQDTPSGDDDY